MIIDKTYLDTYGFEIVGLKEATTKEEQVKALEAHLSLLDGLNRDAVNIIEKRIWNLTKDK